MNQIKDSGEESDQIIIIARHDGPLKINTPGLKKNETPTVLKGQK